LTGLQASIYWDSAMQTPFGSTMALADRQVGTEARKTIAIKLVDGFVQRYLSGSNILDIGYKGYMDDAAPIVPQAIGVDLDYQGYDGRILPFADASQDTVYSSHCLEHIADYCHAIGEWFRVLKPGGYLIIVVPHQFLYEKRTGLPSRWNEDHKRFYTAGSLMTEIEKSLKPNTYRLRHLVDNDLDYDYAIGPEQHAGGCYEIELVIQKLVPPDWELERPPPARSRERVLYSRSRALYYFVGTRLPEPIKAVLRPLIRRTQASPHRLGRNSASGASAGLGPEIK
jgi:SAM-dependent methyltransferase